ncbi:hypothetical protein RU639_000882 [Aspergillus parasiticus]
MDPYTMEVTIHYGHKEYNVGRFLETHKVSDVIGAAKSLLKLPDHPTPYLTCKGVPISPKIPVSDRWCFEVLRISYTSEDFRIACKVLMASHTELDRDFLQYLADGGIPVKVNEVVGLIEAMVDMDALF